MYDKLRRLAHNQKKRPLKKEHTVFVHELVSRYIDQHGLCAYCSFPLTEINVTLDHIQPVSGGGKNLINNVVLACTHCNFLKDDMGLGESIPYLVVYRYLLCRILYKEFKKKNSEASCREKEKWRQRGEQAIKETTMKEYLPTWAQF